MSALVARTASAQATDASCQSGQPCVVVHVVGAPGSATTTTVVTEGDLEDPKSTWVDVVGTTYSTIAYRGGPETAEPIVPRGASILSVLQHLGLTSTVTYATIVGRDRASSTLRHATGDFDDPSPFERGLEPVFWLTGNAFNYIRPLRKNDPDDFNGPEYLQTLDNGELDLTVHTSGSALTPTIAATPMKVRANTPVSFAATADDPDATESLSYTWTFGDGDVSDPQGAQASHPYTTAGTYYAYVDIAGSHGSAGESQTVMITVQAPPSHSATPTPTKHSSSPPPTGTSHGNGSPSNPNHGPTGGSGHHGGGAPQTSGANNSTAGRSPSATAVQTPAPGPSSTLASTAASLPVLTSGSALDTATALPSGAAAGAAASSSEPAHSNSAAVGATATDQIVGYLIAGPAGVALRSPSSSKVDHPPLTAPAARNAATRRQLALWVLYVLGILALLALGIRAEVRRPVRPTDRLH